MTQKIKVKGPCGYTRGEANRFRDDNNNFTAIGENCAKEKRAYARKRRKDLGDESESEARSYPALKIILVLYALLPFDEEFSPCLQCLRIALRN